MLCSSMKRLLYVLIFICFATLVVLQTPLRKFLLQDICLDNGGKWAINGDFCITRDCANDNSCRPHYNNLAVCRTLKTGIPKSEIFFHLGMPDSQDGNVYIFTGGPNASPIKAIIDNNIAIDINCGT
jgi:hypothetical protein